MSILNLYLLCYIFSDKKISGHSHKFSASNNDDNRDASLKPKRVYGPAKPPQSLPRSRSKSPDRSKLKYNARDTWMTEPGISFNYKPGYF